MNNPTNFPEFLKELGISASSRRRRPAIADLIAAIGLWTITVSGSSALGNTFIEVPMAKSAWRASSAGVVEFLEHNGRKAMRLKGAAFVDGLELPAGTIEVDVTRASARSFANVIFAGCDFENFEGFYLRIHRSGQPDAVQYTPHLNGETNWQLFWREQARATFDASDWTTLRLDFTPARARFTVLSDDTSLSVSPVSSESGCSRVGVADFFGGHFSRFRYSADVPELPHVNGLETLPDVIDKWEVSKNFSMVEGEFPPLPEKRDGWDELPTNNGLLLISRFREKSNGGRFENNSEDAVFCRKSILAEAPAQARLDFDFSDRARVYLNGQLLYGGDNRFRLKGPLYRGELELGSRTLVLPLQAGNNELIVAVSDRANCWGLKARLEPLNGVQVQ